MPLATILQLIAGATSVLQQFDGSPQVAKGTAYVQEAVSTISALAPLVEQFGNGDEVTLEDVREALAGKDAALAKLDEIIAAKG